MEELNRSTTCCMTGHRTVRISDEARLAGWIDQAVETLAARGVTHFISGGALGFDQLAAERVLYCKRKHPQIRLVFMIPCVGQDRMWRAEEKRRYAELLRQADEVRLLQEQGYTRYCMQERNRAMVEASGYCIAYCYQQHGGTAHTVRYATARGLTVILLSGDDRDENDF